jgi:class 3 adenylate cyclase
VFENLLAFVPRRCIEQGLLAPEAPPLIEDATTLFIDLAGFTSLTERLARLGSRGSEDLSTVLRRFFGSVTDVVLDHGGDPVAYGGDALTIVFDGPPALTLEHARRATDAIQGLVAETAGTPTAAGQVTLQTRIGIARGPVVTAVAHSRHRSVPVHVGAGLDQAVDAESTATPGEVVLHASASEADHTRPGEVTSSRASSAPTPEQRELERLVHPALLPRLAIGAALLETHRVVTVAFTRFDPVQPGQLPEFLSRVAHLLEVVEAGGGEVMQVSGGDKGILAMTVFGAPVARDDDPLRAVDTMLELRRTQRTVATGVATGPVFTGLVGSSRRCFPAATGPAVNLAARLTQAAAPGQLLVDGFTWHGAPGHLRAQGPPQLMRAKGVENPVEVRAVRGWRRSRRHLSAVRAPLVGRARELDAIERLLDEVSQGGTPVLVFDGEPGSGKTRLVTEAADRARTREVTAVLVDAADHPRGRQAGLWRDVLCALDVGPARAGRGRWAEALGSALPDVPEQIPALARLLDVAMSPSDLTRSMPPEIEAELAHTLFARMVRRAAQSRPILLVIENIHTLDEPSLEVLATLTRAPHAVTAGLVLTRRPTDGGSVALASLPGEHLQVGELTPPDAALLAADVWGQLGGGLPPEWLPEAVARRAGANPLLIQTVTRALHASWEPGQPPPRSALADASLRALLAERVDLLPAPACQLLHLLAVAKHPVTPELAETILGHGARRGMLPEAAEHLVAADLVRVDIRGEVDEYRILHDVLQQVVYDQLSHAERKRLHRSLANHLAREGADPVQVADHVSQLDDQGLARHWFPRAATSARASWSIAEALGWWQRALPLLGGAEREAAEVELVELLLIGGRAREVLSMLSRSTETTRHDLLTARRLHAEAEAAFLSGLFDRSEVAVNRVLALTDGADEARHQRALELLVRVRSERGDTRAATATARLQLQRAQAVGDARAIATAHASLGMALLLGNHAEEAAKHYKAARASAAALGDVVLEIHALSDLAGCRHAMGAFGPCVEMLTKARELAEGIGYRRHLAYNLTNEAEVRSSLGDPAAGACAAMAVKRNLELGDLGAAADAVHTWITSDPRLVALVAVWRRLLAIDVALGRESYAAEAAAQLAVAEARAGHVGEARRAAEDAIRWVRGTEQPHVVLRAHLAGLLAAAGPRGTRSPRKLAALLDGLSALASSPGASDNDRAEIAMERWRASRDEAARQAAIPVLHAAFAVEPSAVVRTWCNEIGTRTPTAPPPLPPPVGMSRLRTTRQQLVDALTAVEAAVTPAVLPRQREATRSTPGPGVDAR